jgi:hypothetical protein
LPEEIMVISVRPFVSQRSPSSIGFVSTLRKVDLMGSESGRRARMLWGKSMEILFTSSGLVNGDIIAPSLSKTHTLCNLPGVGIFEPGIHPGKPPDDLIDFKMRTEWAIFLFHNVRTLASTVTIPPSTIWDHLQKVPIVGKYLWWVSHALDDVIKRA